MIDCLDVKQLTGLLDDELTDAERERAQEHLGGCTSCQRRLRLAAGLDDGVPWGRLAPDWAASETVASARARAARETKAAPEGYEVLEELGRGGMGVVFKARHLALGRLVALKMLLDASDEPRQRFRAEAGSVARLNHPGVVQVYEVGECDGRPFLAMEYVAGGSLAGRLRGSAMPAREAAALVAAAARAVQAAHEAGVVHRDLKPANVLLAQDGTPKVTDFGLAKQLGSPDGPTRTGQVMGTPSYMAPEQACAGAVGPATDVYGLGAVLYECLTGRPPFKAPTTVETLRQVLADDPAPVRGLQPGAPADLETICHKCLQKGPARRYASARELADDLERFLDGQPIHARPAGPFEVALKWARRRPTAAALLGAALAALAAVLAVWWYFTADLQLAKEQAEANERLALASATRAEANEARAKQKEAEAKKNEMEMRRQKAIADLALRKARESAAEIAKFAVEGPELQGRGMETLRRRLLERSALLQQALLAAPPVKPSSLLQMAEYFSQLADLVALQDGYQASLVYSRKALEFAEQADAVVAARKSAARGQAAFAKGQLARMQHNLAQGLSQAGQAEEAERLFKTSLANWDRARADERPSDRQANLMGSAKCHVFYGHLLRQAKKLGQARTQYSWGWEKAKQADSLGSNKTTLEVLATCTSNVAGMYTLAGDHKEAARVYQEVDQAFARLARLQDGPPSLAHLYSHGVNLSNLAGSLQKLKRHDEAFAAYGRGIEALRKLVRKSPKVRTYRIALANAQYAAAELYHQLKRGKEAAEAYKQTAATLAVLLSGPSKAQDVAIGLSACLLRWLQHGPDDAELPGKIKEGIELLGPFRKNAATRARIKAPLIALHKARAKLLRAAGMAEEAQEHERAAEAIKEE